MRQKKYQGSLLASVMVLIFMYSTVFYSITAYYQHQQRLVTTHKKYYQLRILENMALTTIQSNRDDSQGELFFDLGKVTYKISQDEVNLETQLKTGGSLKNKFKK